MNLEIKDMDIVNQQLQKKDKNIRRKSAHLDAVASKNINKDLDKKKEFHKQVAKYANESYNYGLI